MRETPPMRRRWVVLSLCCVTSFIACEVRADSVVYGGPTYVRATGGFLYPDARMSSAIRGDLSLHGGGFYGRTVNDHGTAVGYAAKFVTSTSRKGDLAFRWGLNESAVELQSLPAYSSNPYGYAFAVNNAGTAVGYSYLYNTAGQNTGEQAVRWSADGTTVTPLGTLGTVSGSGYSRAYAINDAGTAVGSSEKRVQGNNWAGYRAVRWFVNSTTPQELGNLGLTASTTPYTTSEALDINASGTAVGYAFKQFDASSSGTRAVRWDAGSTVATELGGIGPNADTMPAWAMKVNDAGTAVGYGVLLDAGNKNLGERAIRWDAGGTAATQLGALGTAADGSTTSFAADVNNAGTTVGYCWVYDDAHTYKGLKPVRWEAGSTEAIPLAPLISLGGGTSISSNAYAINDLGAIAGTADAGDKLGNSLGTKAVVWLPDGVALDLNTRLTPVAVTDPTWKLLRATAISNTGFVSGTGFYDLDGAAYGNEQYLRHFSILVPEAGTYGQGDANFDEHVNFDDLLVLAKHYGQANASFATDVADLDLNGTVDFNDLLTLAKQYEAGTPAAMAVPTAIAGDWALAQSLVPEPTLTLCALLAVPLTRCRR